MELSITPIRPMPVALIRSSASTIGSTGPRRDVTKAAPGFAATTSTRRSEQRKRLAHATYEQPPRTNQKSRGGTDVPRMHREHSSDGRRSWIDGRNSGGVHRQV